MWKSEGSPSQKTEWSPCAGGCGGKVSNSNRICSVCAKKERDEARKRAENKKALKEHMWS